MLDGMLNVYKEAGFTSNDVVAKLRGILKQRKIGHTGTLDPDAVGVLPVCLGKGTKLCELIADRDKEYVAVLRLGVVTDTQDVTGAVLRRIPEEEVRESVSEAGVREMAASFLGDIDQIPPMYSALKVNGKKLYELARAGQTIERAARRIHIYELEIEKIELPLVRMRIRCSKGTYIRTLCHDIGEKLGVGGAMESLVRTRVGIFRIEEAKTLSEIEAIVKGGDAQSTAGGQELEMEPACPERVCPGCQRPVDGRADDAEPVGIQELVYPIESFFADAPRAVVRPEALRYLDNGNALRADQVELESGEDADCALEQGAALPDTGKPGDVQKQAAQGSVPDGMRVRICDPEGRFRALYRYAADRRSFLVEKMF
ncbi:MAG: tRNA pseudouridine(55) synthase TruB [Eubacteriales bacterium]|nr:tRNA pseudouridine(55) synthase TruB [Eubacteriales bacterium]